VNISDLKDHYLGQRAFIIGNGPSLRYAPFVALMDEWTFATNRIALIFPLVAWRPSFYTLVTDGYWIYEYRASYDQGLRESQVLNFVDINYLNIVPKTEKNKYLHCRYAGDYLAEEAQDNWWSDDPTQWVSRWGTSSVVSIQMASYMGFNPIYLIGFDLGFKPQLPDGTDICHFDPRYWGDYQCARKNYNYTALHHGHVRAHEICRVNAERKGISIINAGFGGELEVYSRADLLDVLNADS